VVYEDGQVEDLTEEETRDIVFFGKIPYEKSFLCMKYLVQREEAPATCKKPSPQKNKH
jgi:hypothetical protein